MESFEPMLTTEDVANYLKVDVVTIRRLINRGEIAAYRIGGEYRFTQQDVADYLQRQHIPARGKQAQRTVQLSTDPADTMLQRFSRSLSQPAPPSQPEISFDTFTKRAKHVLKYAQEEARSFNHPYVGTEHILLGLIREGEGVAGKALDELGVKYMQAHSAVEFNVGRGEDKLVDTDLELTASAKKIIEYAIDESRELGHQYVGAEHLLLGLTRKGEGIAAGVLEIMGVSLQQVRQKVMELLDRKHP